MSNVTAPFRLGLINDDLNIYARDMVAYPRIHFLIPSIAPIISNKKQDNKYKDDIQSLTDSCLLPSNWLLHMADFDVDSDQYIALQFNYRGNKISQQCLKEANDTMKWLEKNKKYKILSWLATQKPSLKFIDNPCGILSDNDIMEINKDKFVSAVMNNACISRIYSERISKKYDLLYSQRAYVHWYVGWGMEEGEFAEAREDLGFLEKDYLDILTMQDYDDSDDEDRDDDEDV